jgi:Sec-independent protein secretion pathway component TatC
VTLLGSTVIVLVLMPAASPTGRISRACPDALMALAVLEVVCNVAMLATSPADPVAAVLLFGASAGVLMVVPVQRRRLRRHLQAVQGRLDQARRGRPSEP